ncbi:MAG: glycosyltransferase family 4 protein [Thermoplasmata archaeon]|nr:glycosyltransferase family 4 protein [Thermoplasmata archaeon]
MRILLVGTGVEPIPPTGYGGVERTLAEYLRALEAAGEAPVLLHHVRRGRSTDEYRFALELPRLLRGVQADIVHASTPVVANRLRWLHRPYVYTSHSRHWFSLRGPTQRWGFFLERRAVAGSAATVALTNEIAAKVRARLRGSAPARMPVIPIGVDADRFRPNWAARTGHVALAVGVVAPVKRWEIAAAALRGTGIALRIAGPTPDAAYAQAVRSSGENVELLGEVSEEQLLRAYAESDLLLHPSAAEILSGTVLQGLAAGLPILGAAPVGPLVQQGVTGFTTAPDATPELIARELRERAIELARDDVARRTMGEAARKSALERFAWPAVVARHLALYREVLGAP